VPELTRLGPVGVDELGALHRDLLEPPAHEGRPHVALNFVMTADGRVSYRGRAEIGTRTDRALMVQLRSLAGAVMIGAGTLLYQVTGNSAYLFQARQTAKAALSYFTPARLGGAIAAKLGQPASAAGGIAIATVLVAPGDDATTSAVRALAEHFRGEVGISSWNGIAVARLCVTDGAALRHDLIAVLAALGAPVPRLWLN